MSKKVIKSNEEHQLALSRLSDLMSEELRAGSHAFDEAELLMVLISDYERKIISTDCVSPVEAILFRMEQMQLKRTDLLPFIGSASKVSEVLSGKRTLSLAMIRKLRDGLGISADILLGEAEQTKLVEKDCLNLDFAQFPLKEMEKRNLFHGIKNNLDISKDYAEDIVRQVVDRLRVDLSTLAMPLFRAPLSQHHGRVPNAYSLLAWQFCVLSSSRTNTLKIKYEKGTICIDWLRQLAQLSRHQKGPLLAKKYLALYGISLVIEPAFPRTYLDGAAMLDGDDPVIAITLRHDRVDNFWFVLFHELAHVDLHLSRKCSVFFDDNVEKQGGSSKAEKDADGVAEAGLLDCSQFRLFLDRKDYRASAIRSFAASIGIHPAIVAGRVRYATKNWKTLSSLLCRGTVSPLFSSSRKSH